jgi:hypothetical protein
LTSRCPAHESSKTCGHITNARMRAACMDRAIQGACVVLSAPGGGWRLSRHSSSGRYYTSSPFPFRERRGTTEPGADHGRCLRVRDDAARGSVGARSNMGPVHPARRHLVRRSRVATAAAAISQVVAAGCARHGRARERQFPRLPEHTAGIRVRLGGRLPPNGRPSPPSWSELGPAPEERLRVIWLRSVP